MRFFALDINTEHGVELGVRTDSYPLLIMYPAFHKYTAAYMYDGEINGIEMAKWLHRKADIAFELKKTFFTPPEDPFKGAVMMDMDADGNVMPTPEKIAELQAKQDKETL